MKKLKLPALLSVFALLAASAAHAQDSSALLDLLVKKKVISEQEAENTRAEMAKETQQESAAKIKLSTPVKQLTIYGDARLRYDWREANAFGPNAAGASDTASASQFRYRLRLGANVDLTDQWFLGFRLETSNNPRSTNVTFGNSGSNIAPFGKGGTGSSTVVTGVGPTKTGTAVSKVDFGSAIFVGQAYLRYSPYSWATFEGGKIPNPFIATPMVWDPDINPEGFAEQFKYTIGPFGGSVAPVAGDGKDSKDKEWAVAKNPPGGTTVDFFANLAQMVYDTASPQNQFGTSIAGRNDTWMFGTQVGAKVNFNKNLYVQVAPAFYNYSGKKGNDFNTPFVGDPGTNQIGINDLTIVDVPAEFGWKFKEIPFRLFTDYAVNLRGQDRANAAGHPLEGKQDTAWQAGIGINKVKKKGDWELTAAWQRSEQFSLDPNLIDNDIFDAHLNMQGIILRAGYAVTDAVTLNLTLNHGEIIDKKLGTGGAGGSLNGSSSSPTQRNYNLIQADLNIKF